MPSEKLRYKSIKNATVTTANSIGQSTYSTFNNMFEIIYSIRKAIIQAVKRK